MTLAITVDGQIIHICVADDGLGFEPGAKVSHNGDGQHDGLRNMQQRMLDVRGTFQVESSVGVGTRVTLKLDLGNLSHTLLQEPKADSYANHSLHR